MRLYRIILVFLVSSVLIPLLQVIHAQDDFMFPNDVYGEYHNEATGLSITFPEGWSGIELFGIYAVVAPEGVNFMHGSPEVSMMIIALNHSAFTGFEDQTITQHNTTSSDCTYLLQSFKVVNGMSTLHGISECEGAESFTKTNVYLFLTDNKILGVMYTANSTQAYDGHLAEFEQSIKTLRIQNTINMEQGLTKVWNLSSTTRSFTVKSSSVDLRIDSSSAIANVTMDEGSKTVSIELNATDNQRGFMRVPISDLLEGPYTVTIDGSVVENAVIEDEPTGRIFLMFPYEQNANQVVITGTNVVPEFPLTALIAAGAIGGTAILVRFKIYKR